MESTISCAPLIKTFSSFASSLILNDDEAAWNLAYLSYDFEKLRSHPDPHFSTHVRRTLQHVLLTGETDLAGKVPAHLTVRGFFRFPPPKAMFQLLAMKRREALPLFKAYGTGWLVLAEQRSHLWQEPYDSALDALVTELSHLAQKRW